MSKVAPWLYAVLLFVVSTSCSLFDNDSKKDKKKEEASAAQAAADANSVLKTAFYVSSFDQLPTCSPDLEKGLYYVADEAAFYVCGDDGWATVASQGPAGADGAPGEVGPQGDFGDGFGEQFRGLWQEAVLSTATIAVAFGDSADDICYTRIKLGSGFVVGEDLVATNQHVVDVAGSVLASQLTADVAEDCTQDRLNYLRMEVFFPQDNNGRTNYESRDPDGFTNLVDLTVAERDIVLLQAETGDRPALVLSERVDHAEVISGPNLKLGEKVLLLGYGGEAPVPQFSFGNVLAINQAKNMATPGFDVPEETIIVSFDSPSLGGTSGGALIDTNGQVVGVNFAGATEAEYQYAISVNHLAELLAADRNWQEVHAPPQSFSLADGISFEGSENGVYRYTLTVDEFLQTQVVFNADFDLAMDIVGEGKDYYIFDDNADVALALAPGTYAFEFRTYNDLPVNVSFPEAEVTPVSVGEEVTMNFTDGTPYRLYQLTLAAETRLSSVQSSDCFTVRITDSAGTLTPLFGPATFAAGTYFVEMWGFAGFTEPYTCIFTINEDPI